MLSESDKYLPAFKFGGGRSAVVLLLVICGTPGEAGETDCSDALRGPAAREDEKWVAFVGNLSQEVSDSDQEGKGFDIMWFGDSITETLRGSCIGEPWAVAEGAPEVLQDFFGQYHSGIMGICADKVGNLWWRLLNGGLPQKRFPKLAIVLIGTNDLTAADCHHDPQDLMDAAQHAAARIEAVVGVILSKMPSTEVVIQGILPRGAEIGKEPLIWLWPNRFTLAINDMNSRLSSFAMSTAHVHFVNCGDVLTAGPAGLNREYLRDGVHVSAAGWSRYFTCLHPAVQQIMTEASSQSAQSLQAATLADAPQTPALSPFLVSQTMVMASSADPRRLGPPQPI